MESTPLPKAILCDMDGTLTDSEDWWFEAEVEVFARYGVTWTMEDVRPYIGASIAFFTSDASEKYGLPISADALRDEILSIMFARAKEAPTPWRPGARELLELCVGLGIPTALVTSSVHTFARYTLKDAPEGSLTVMVTGDMPFEGKPSPAPYLEAARRLGVLASECLVVEDSTFGVRAGRAAGAAVAHVANYVDVEPQPGVTKLDTLEGITEVDLRRLAAVSR